MSSRSESPRASESSTNTLNLSAVEELRRTLTTSDECAVLVCGLVEEIGDTETYDAYVRTNSEIFKPWASEFSVLSRAYTKDMSHFVVHWVSPLCSGFPGKTVDRMPIVFSRGKGALHWLLSDAYIGKAGNITKRHASSSHAQLYLATGPISTSSPMEATAADVDCSYMIFELWEGNQRFIDELGTVISSHGGQCIVCADGRQEAGQETAESLEQNENTWTPELNVMEGAHAGKTLLALWRLGDWSATESCAASAAFAEVVKLLEAEDCLGRIIAFDKKPRSDV